MCEMVETVERGRLAATWRGRVRGPAQCTVTWIQKVAAVLSKGGLHHLTALTVTAQEQEQGRCSLLGGSINPPLLPPQRKN